jgi:hypothetical protein
VYKVREVAGALIAAAQRGCDVAVVLESEAESGGKVTFEMAATLGSDVAAHAKLYTWPYFSTTKQGQPPSRSGGPKGGEGTYCKRVMIPRAK